jgi:ribosome-interacting GTPase 1
LKVSLFSGTFVSREVGMPANLPPQYFEAEREFKNAKTIPEKIAALEAMMAIMPHHKGTDKLRAEHTRKMAQLKEQAESVAKGKRGSLYSIEKQGTAQVLLVGFPNSGKSSLLASLTKAAPLIADYPYTTTQPEVGMMLRTADAIMLIVDGSGDPETETKLILEDLREGKVHAPPAGDERPPVGAVVKKMLVVMNKCDVSRAAAPMDARERTAAAAPSVVSVSAKSGAGLTQLRDAIYRLVDIIRVYSKVPGKKADLSAPFVLPAGSTVMDFAREIHRDFAQHLRFARVWGSARFEGQAVQYDYVLRDRDIIELHC